MNKSSTLILGAVVAVAAMLFGTRFPSVAAAPPIAREIYVPFEELNVLLEGPVRRVLMTREEYDALLVKAKLNPTEKLPHQASFLSAEYDVRLEDLRAFITAKLTCDVLANSLQALSFDLGQVGIQEALLDGKPAALRRTSPTGLMLVLEGRGRHELTLKMVALLETNASEQTLKVELPRLPSSKLHVSAEGNVEVRGGADLISRKVDEKTGRTELELLPADGPMALSLSLNNRTRRQQKVVVARCVVVDEVTSAYERLHATVSLSILHQAVDKFRFAIPDGFEISEVQSQLLARWSTTTVDGKRVLEVALRQETTEGVVLNIAAVRSPARLDAWTFPKLEPLDTVGNMAVVGLLLEDRLKAEGIAAEKMLPIDNEVLTQALPASVFAAEPGAPRVRPVVAYYAPDGTVEMQAKFVRPPARVLATTNLLLALAESGLDVRGGFALNPEAEALHDFDFTAPAGWTVAEVTTADGAQVPFERYGAADAAGRIHVRLSKKIAAGKTESVYFHAVHVPAAWLDAWTTTNVEFPKFAAVDAALDAGALAMVAKDDLTIRPDVMTNLTPLDEAEQPKYGLADVAGQLAYRYDAPGYRAALVVERTKPRLTARTYSFLRIDPDVVTAHYELVYDIARARSRRLEFLLPATTPAAVTLRGLDGVVLKEYSGTDVAAGRLWRVLLSDAAQGRIRLAVDFHFPLPKENTDKIPLPIVRAEGVAYQSGVVAVEGHADVDVQVVTHPRKVDVGELAEADYQTGRRLLGAFGFVGDESRTVIGVARHANLGLQPAIVQSAKYVTVLGGNGRAQTSAEFRLRTKAGYLEAKLPEGSTLWSVLLDGQAAQPQREGDRILLGFPSADGEKLRTLKIAYETETAQLAVFGRVRIPALGLYLRTAPKAPPQEVPMADARWELHLPSNYRVVGSHGTLSSDLDERREPLAIANVVGVLWELGGGSGFFSGAPENEALPARMTSKGGSGASAMMDRGAVHDRDLNAGNSHTAGMSAPGPIDDSKSMSPPAEQPKAEPSVADPFGDRFRAMPSLPTTPPPVVNSPTAAPKKTATKFGKSGSGSFDLAGVRSLKIDLESTGDVAVFESLGIDPRLDVTLVDRRRSRGLALFAASVVILYGAFLAFRPWKRKLRYIAVVGLITTLLPLLVMRRELVPLVNPSFYAACLLLPFYLVVGIVCRVICFAKSRCVWPAFTAAFLLSAQCLTGVASAAEMMPPATGSYSGTGPIVVQVAPPPVPVRVPDDAVLLLYHDLPVAGLPRADQLLVPYDRYQQLWDRAYPQKRAAPQPPAHYSTTGAAYRSTLVGEDFLLIEGTIDFELFSDEFVQIPLPLTGGVLASATLDGKPARLNFGKPAPPAAPRVQPVPQMQQAQPMQQSAAPAAPSLPSAPPPLLLVASGKGKHRLDLAVRLTLEKAGGWRIAEGTLPVAPATSLALTVPQADTDLRLGGIPDRRNHTTSKPNETFTTALGADGALRVEWRAKINASQVDDSLKAKSEVVFAVQDDGLRLAWRTALEFGAVRRERFTVVVPKDYLVERVTGRNVRGWEPRDVGEERKLDIDLLRPASNNEEFAIFLSRRTHFDAMPTVLPVPVVAIEGAAMHNGNISIRRSSILDLRTLETTGLARIDSIEGIESQPATADRNDVSPLGMRNYESYRFAAVPFTFKLSVVPLVTKATSETNSILKIAERERHFETQIKLRVGGAPIHRFRAYLPDGLRLDQVTVGGTFEWAVTTVDGRSLLTIYFASGHTGDVEILLAGMLGKAGPTLAVPLPRLEVLDVEKQSGQLVVQVDPAFDVEPTELRGCEQELLDRTFAWLREAQRTLARIALRTTSGDYGGTIKLTVRKPTVGCQTITNVRVTDRAIEETILLDFTIRDAGIREAVFRIPAALADAKIEVPQLREKKLEPIGDDGKFVRVRLQLQDEVMGQLRVLVESDRLRTAEVQVAPIPVVETVRTDGRFVTLESFGRDELVRDKMTGLEPLTRQQQQWQVVAGLLRGGSTEVFRVEPDAVDPQLTYRTRSRETVETAGARIGLAEAMLVVDEFGAYRAVQSYRVDNKTEQYLLVEMPQGATLWTAWVAGEPVKPIAGPTPTATREVRVPLVKTAEGDLDYEVKLVYGGKLAAPSSFTKVSFPLIRTVNVKVELSQVRLYLPETMDWIEFGGNMRLVEEEAVLQAGNIAYYNKSTEKLAQTLERGDEFAKARASNSLRELKSNFRSKLDLSGANTYTGAMSVESGELRQELARNEQLWKEAEKQQQTHAAQAMPQPSGTSLFLGNSSVLSGAYSGQANARAKNVVTNLGVNFNADGAQAEVTKGTGEGKGAGGFDKQWLNSNGLIGMNGRSSGELDGRLSKSGSGSLTINSSSTIFNNTQTIAPQVAQGQAREALQKELDADRRQMGAGQQGMRRDDGGQQTVQNYERRLSEQSKLSIAGRGARGVQLEDIAVAGKPGDQVVREGDLITVGEKAREGFKQAQDAEYAALAGLDVQIPKRGKLYRFTTPLGDAEITGRPVSHALALDLTRIAIVALLAILALIAARYRRNLRLSWFHETKAGPITLVGLGFLSIVIGLLPIYGTFLLVGGIVLLLFRLSAPTRRLTT